MGILEGKVAIITGASSGIGRACFDMFASEGARVVGVSRTQSKLDEALAAVKAAGGKGVVVAGDLGESATAKRMVEVALAEFGRIDILIHAAGVGYSLAETVPGSMNDTVSTTDENWRTVTRINFDSCFYAARAVLPTMQAQHSGSIVNVASIYGLGGYADAHCYTATKAGVINFTRSLCVAYAKDGIRANCLAPGFVDTPMIASVRHVFDDKAVAASLCPMGRFGQPDEIANACLFLASDMSSYCNGSVLVVDGGSTAPV